jgi:hypothetical protein
MYRRIGGMGQTSADDAAKRAAANQKILNFWADLKDIFNPSLQTSEVGANIYQRYQYGSIPTPTEGTVPGGTAPNLPVSYDPATGTATDNTTGETVQITDPTARGQALRDLINQAIASGAYTPSGTPIASDLSDLTGGIPGWVWWAGAGLLAVVALGAVGGRH